MNIKCHICGSSKITFYRQKIKGGRVYVTARCENEHSPVKGKPFFEQWRFDVENLPFLGEEPIKREKAKTQVPYINFPLPIEE